MQIRIGNFEFTEVWDGVFYKKLSGYPRITDWELRTLIEFTDYEKANGRDCEVLCEDERLREKTLRLGKTPADADEKRHKKTGALQKSAPVFQCRQTAGAPPRSQVFS